MQYKRLAQMREHTKQLGILVVGENPLYHDIYKQTLFDHFKSYESAVDGLDGLDKYQANPEKYDIIISAYKMSNMDGVEMIKWIKEAGTSTHIILAVEVSEVAILAEIPQDISIDTFIIEPIKAIALLSKIDDISSKMIEMRELQVYLEELESMNQAVWNFKDRLKKEISLLSYIPEAKTIHDSLIALIDTPIALLAPLEEGKVQEILEEEDADFDVEAAMRSYKEEPKREDKTFTEMTASVKEQNAEKVSAVAFIAELDKDIFGEVDDFREDLDNFNLLLNDMSLCEGSHFYGYLDQVSDFYIRLYHIVNRFIVFPAISDTFKSFASFIEGIKREQLEERLKQDFLLDALFALSEDLSQWMHVIFYERKTENIHYLDASFANTCLEIETVFEINKLETSKSDAEALEFF